MNYQYLSSRGAEAPSEDRQRLLSQLKAIVGPGEVLSGKEPTRRYRLGIRFGGGPCLAVVRPGSLVEQWRVVKACVAADVAIIMQAANTGLTGGSTPDGADYDRDVVIINTLRMTGVQVIDDGRQVICLPGSTLYQLEAVLKPHGREPHSVIGSSCIGASVLGGVCNNSGGALVRRGPAFTEMALYAQVAEDGSLHLINHLGIELGDDPETALARLERGDYVEADITRNSGRRASDGDYTERVRQVDANTPARFNADPARLYEASGSAGKVAVFAVRLDTFEPEPKVQTFYIGTNDPAELTEIRRHVLQHFSALPIAGEYMHRDAFDLAAEYGKDMFVAIKRLGTDRLPTLFRWKSRVDNLARRMPFLPKALSDRVMQTAGRVLPPHLPARMVDFRNRFEHHLILKMGGASVDEARAYFAASYPSSAGDIFECTTDEAAAAFLNRFVAAGAAIRYRNLHPNEVEDIVALDIALRRNDRDWLEVLPEDVEKSILKKIYYGHFICHVFHQDYIVRKGVDTLAVEHRMWELLDARGAEYPAEHNVGHLYPAKPALAAHYRQLDPCNTFNPGVGQTSKLRRWRVESDPRRGWCAGR
jgi:D-lactate dehydrogenase